MWSQLWVKNLLILVFTLILASCGTNPDTRISPSKPASTDTGKTSFETIIPGKTECGVAGDISPDGKYVCAGRGMFYWISLLDLATGANEDSNSDDSNNGYWTTNCVNVQVPNPNYNASKGFSAVVNEPTIRTQRCSQIWVQK